MRQSVREGFLSGLEKAAEGPKFPHLSTVLSAVGGTALGAGVGVTMMRLLQEKMPNKQLPLKYVGPASMVVGGALLLASSMQDRAEREAHRAIDDQERAGGSRRPA